MDNLTLRPLPSETRTENRLHLRLSDEGFVDEALVSGVISRGAYERVFVQPEGMVLSSSEDDFAGWALPVASPFRGMRETQAPADAPVRLPAPPVSPHSENGIEIPYAGGHRWWLFGACGALTCGLLSLTLLSLAQRSEVHGIAADFMPVPIHTEAPAPPAAESAAQPALTKALPDFR
jgi:hypothetical protein